VKYEQINKDLLEQIKHLELELQTFHGIRHIWAEQVANHIPCGISTNKLEKLQCERLTSALGQAYVISRKLDIAWIGSNADRAMTKELYGVLNAVRVVLNMKSASAAASDLAELLPRMMEVLTKAEKQYQPHD